jgi:hypothetical protein
VKDCTNSGLQREEIVIRKWFSYLSNHWTLRHNKINYLWYLYCMICNCCFCVTVIYQFFVDIGGISNLCYCPLMCSSVCLSGIICPLLFLGFYQWMYHVIDLYLWGIKNKREGKHDSKKFSARDCTAFVKPVRCMLFCFSTTLAGTNDLQSLRDEKPLKKNHSSPNN